MFLRKPDIEFVDSYTLKTAYRELQRKTVNEISVMSCIPLPDFSEEAQIKQALIGSVSVKAYLSIVETEEHKLSKGLFYDNVREFQGINRINKEK